ncbi:MAG: hypothetical protein AAFX03_12190 [Pseudomonadota bacterium]
MTKLSIDIDESTLKRLRAIAAREGQALETYLADRLARDAANDETMDFTQEQIALIQASLDDPRPSLSHDEVMVEIDALIDGL